MMSDQVCFVDTETTGLDPDRHEIWEVGLIIDEEEHHWFLPVNLGYADPFALKIGGFHDRHPDGYDIPRDLDDLDRWASLTPPEHFAREFAHFSRGRHLVGAVVSFDAERLSKLLKANGACPEWHYHLIDVEALMVGYLAGRAQGGDLDAGLAIPDLPWKSRDLSLAVGVDPEDFQPAHTALTDARWAKACYEAVMGAEVADNDDGEAA